MQINVEKHTPYGGMDEHKQKWLKNLVSVDDKSVLDCNPSEGIVVMKLGGKVFKRRIAERWTRVMGYHRPVTTFNPGKKSEHADRVAFKEPKTR